MDIATQLQSIVDALVTDIKTKLDAELQSTIAEHINQALSEYDFDTKVEQLAGPVVERKIAEFPIDTAHISAEIGRIGSENIANLREVVAAQVAQAAKTHVAEFDVTPLINECVENYLAQVQFPDSSIPAKAVNFDNFSLSGDYVKGGIIREFGSTGIDDKATQCQLTIMDNAVVIEQPILTTGVHVKGNTKVEGNLFVEGVLHPESNAAIELTKDIQAATLENIATQGVVAPKLEFNGKTLIDDKELSSSILTSNLRRVGTLEELQTRGETLLDGTLYVHKKRVGINTLEPGYALSVWDEEVEVSINKASQQRAFIGTHRPFAVTLGAHGKENISLDIDGSVTINDLRLGALPISTASTEPNWGGRSGEIVFNDSPKIGVPIGWVCLDGHRWAKFGLIQE